MNQREWQEVLLSPGNEDHAWELFHENSKNGRFSTSATEEEVRDRMGRLHESLPFEGYPIVELPRSLPPLSCSLEQAILGRVSVRELVPDALTLENVATLLQCAYGVNRHREDIGFVRSLRVVPSAGALYPLEIFFHAARVEGLKAGLYHYNPLQNHARLLRKGDGTESISQAMLQPEIARGSAAIIFITAIFERSVFKYGDRGYRFILMEAGHVAQNINLVVQALGLGAVNIGGYYDREIEEYLNIDGVTQSSLSMIAIGQKKKFNDP